MQHDPYDQKSLVATEVSMRAVAMLAALTLLAACTTYWNKPGASQHDFDVENAACNTRSYQAAPVNPVPMTVGTAYVQPSYASCVGGNGTANCVIAGGNYVPPTVIPVDVNDRARQAAYESCMYDHGWSKGKAPEAQVTNAGGDPLASYRAGVDCDQEFGDRKQIENKAYLQCYFQKTCAYGGSCIKPPL